MKNAFLIAAPASNSGKTTVTLGLLRYFSKRGVKIQPFKCGPDYIDTLHHSNAAKNQSINLDTVMMSDSHMKTVFSNFSQEATISIVEGVMGLFDGAVKDKGSSAEIAKKLKLPVVLVLNAKAMAYSAAPLLFGLKNFDPEVKIAGVIFNFVKTASHFSFLKEACEDVGVPCFGYLPPEEKIAIPSRHLGLHVHEDYEELLDSAAKHVGEHLDMDALLAATQYKVTVPKATIVSKNSKKLKIAVAKDEAFNFTYRQNLAYLEQIGDITYFSPLRDTELPEADLLYFAGGYPELYVAELSKNTKMLSQVKSRADKGVAILAECGGMMYLGKGIVTEEGTRHPMVGVFGFGTSMEGKKLHLGYRRVVFENDELWGHEFHYSSIYNDEHTETVGEIYTARNKKVTTKYYTYKNVLASYMHLYWGEGTFGWLHSIKN